MSEAMILMVSGVIAQAIGATLGMIAPPNPQAWAMYGAGVVLFGMGLAKAWGKKS